MEKSRRRAAPRSGAATTNTMKDEGWKQPSPLHVPRSWVRLSLSMRSRHCGAAQVPVLRQPVFRDFRRAILVGAAINHRLRLEIAMWRRRRRGPFQRVRLPGIALRLLAGKQAPEKVSQKEDLRCAQEKRADRDEHVPMLHRQEKFILGG